MKYPEMRNELIGYLFGLSDLQYQKNCWLDGKCPNGIEHDEFSYAVHFFFDDTDLSLDAKSLIGDFLNDENEARLVNNLCQKLKNIFNKYGANMSDEKYLNCPEWKDVLIASALAHKALANS